jgi:hypothetical protein
MLSDSRPPLSPPHPGQHNCPMSGLLILFNCTQSVLTPVLELTPLRTTTKIWSSLSRSRHKIIPNHEFPVSEIDDCRFCHLPPNTNQRFSCIAVSSPINPFNLLGLSLSLTRCTALHWFFSPTAPILSISSLYPPMSFIRTLTSFFLLSPFYFPLDVLPATTFHLVLRFLDKLMFLGCSYRKYLSASSQSSRSD